MGSKGLVALKCAECKRLFMPPRYLCPECGRASLKEVTLSGKGQVYTHTTIRVAPMAFEQQIPYHVAVIRLEEDLNITARLVPEEGIEVELGAPVAFEREDEFGLWFRVIG